MCPGNVVAQGISSNSTGRNMARLMLPPLPRQSGSGATRTQTCHSKWGESDALRGTHCGCRVPPHVSGAPTRGPSHFPVLHQRRTRSAWGPEPTGRITLIATALRVSSNEVEGRFCSRAKAPNGPIILGLFLTSVHYHRPLPRRRALGVPRDYLTSSRQKLIAG